MLDDLRARLSEGDGPWPRIVVLHGLGGVGKTSVALEYVHGRWDDGAGIVWQFPAGNPAVLADAFTRFARQIGAAGSARDLQDCILAVHSFLARTLTAWVLMFDDAPGPDSIQPFVPRAGNGQVLITSQNALWPPSQAVAVQLLGKEVAARFLAQRTGDPDGRAARYLAEEMDGLPLALEQAGAYMQATGTSLARYLDLFRRQRAKLLAEGSPSGYSGTVATTFALAFSRLEGDTPQAAAVLRMLACLAPDPIPLDLLLGSIGALAEPEAAVAETLAPLIGNSVAQGNAIIALRRYSLVNPTRGGLILVHRLVQAVAFGQMPASVAGAWKHVSAMLIEAAVPGDPHLPASWPAFRALLPHAQAVLDLDSEALLRIALFLGSDFSYAGAFHALMQRYAVYAEQTVGIDHPATKQLRLQAAFAEALEAGERDPVAALGAMSKLLPEEIELADPEDEAGREALAVQAALLQTRDPAQIRDLYIRQLRAIERMFDPGHPYALQTGIFVAVYTGLAGNRTAARDMLAELLPRFEQAFGFDHPINLWAYPDFAEFTGWAGDVTGARDLYERLLPELERALGPEHENVLKARYHHAEWTGRAGDPAAARDMDEALVNDLKRLPGSADQLTKQARAALFGWKTVAMGQTIRRRFTRRQ